MTTPFFYISSYGPGQTSVTLDEINSKHAIQVLRLRKGDAVLLTDGCGTLLQGTIADEHRKACVIQIESVQTVPPPTSPVLLAVSPLKNTSRFEWLLEKVTELGVHRIIPIRCDRTEKENLRTDRLRSVLVSALLQSRQCWLPVLEEPMPFTTLTELTDLAANRCIAYCGEAKKISLNNWHPGQGATLVCIGPEGDFTEAEHAKALQSGFTTVHLGANRLRTETAAMVAVALLTQRAGA
ncbi:MAG: RsmE family RNA methyltransferase [Sphingomonadales bacterium]